MDELLAKAELTGALASTYADLVRAIARSDEALDHGTFAEHEIAVRQVAVLETQAARIELELSVLRACQVAA